MNFLSNILAKAGLIVDGTVTLNSVANASTDTDRFIVIDNGVVKYRTGSQLRSDIDAASAAAGLPVGGAAGQILAKIDGTNYNTEWIDNYTTDLRQTVKAGEAINKGQAVYISGADGTNIIVSKASNASEATSSKTLGLLAQNLANNGQGFVITEGKLTGIDTSTAQAGDPVWLGTNGNLLFGMANKPVAPAHLVYLGVVTRANQNNGEIFIHVQNGFELNEIHDVLVGSYGTKDVLWRDTATNLWKNRDIFNLIGAASGSANGYLTSTDWNTFNNKQNTLSLTTTGNSGASTLVGATLNVPEYTLSGLGGVPTTRTLTINGTALDLSANRSWSVGTVTSVGLTSATSGVTISDSPVTVSGTIGIAIATANGSQQGLLSGTDWTTFNNKQNAITLTTTGTSGAASLIGATLNIPEYQAQGNYITSLTGEATASGPGAASVTLSTTAVTGKLLTGLNLSGGGTIAATDSILTAFGKVQNQISAMVGGVMYQGTWNASTNTPTLTSSVGTKGNYYIVDVSGTTNLNGITDWRVGDWAIFNGSTWDKVDNTDAVSSVNGFTGAVSLTTSHITEGTNLYYLDSRSRTAISLTTTGNSGAATYDNVSGIINVPQYTLTGLGGVPSTRQITINGTAFDLSADRSWSVGTVTSVGLNSTTSGITITNTPVTSSGALTINIATASGSQNGLLSSTDWNSFNTGLGELIVSVAFTPTDLQLTKANSQVIGATVPLANGSQVGFLSTTDYNTFNNKIGGSGTSGQVAYFSGTNSVTGESNLFWDASNDRLGIGISPATRLDVSGTIRTTDGVFQIFEASAFRGGLYPYNRVLGSGTDYTPTLISETGLYFAVSGSATRAMTLTPSGNLGLGVTPSAWGSDTVAIQLGGSVFGAVSANLRLLNLANAYNDGANFRYINTGVNALQYRISGGTGAHEWYVAPSGTAGNAISFTQAMTLDASGRLGIGSTSPSVSLVVSNAGAAGFEFNPNSAGLAQLETYNRSTSAYVGFRINADDIRFHTGSGASERMRITSGGSLVVLGSNSSSTPFALGTSTPKFQLMNGGVYGLAGDVLTNGNSYLQSQRTDGNTAAYNLLLQPLGGNVGIGTATPATRLEAFVSRTNGTNVNVLTLSDSLTGISTPGFGTRIQGLSNNGGVISAIGFENGGTGTNNESQLSFYTQNTAGALTRQMLITSTGNVGIGTASPVTRLTVNGGSANTSTNYQFKNISVTSGFSAGYTNTAIQSLLAGYDGNTIYATDFGYGYDGTGYALMFSTNDNTSGDPIERMRITSGGNVGIGTTTPATRLDVNGSIRAVDLLISNDRLYLNGNRPISDWISDSLTAGYSSTNSYGWVNSANNLVLGTNGTERMRITSGGNVGIGTAIPDAIFHVARANAGGVGGQLVIDNSAVSTLGNTAEISFLTDVGASGAGTRNARILAVNENVNDGRARMEFHTWNGSTSAERMRITSGGNVGIGTASPSARLDVQGGSIINGNGTIQTAITYATMGIVGTLSNHDLSLYSNNTERMRITSGGNVGIGTSSPGATLDVNGTIRTADLYGGTAHSWKLGKAYAGAPSTPTITVEVEINGSIYQIGATTV